MAVKDSVVDMGMKKMGKAGIFLGAILLLQAVKAAGGTATILDPKRVW